MFVHSSQTILLLFLYLMFVYSIGADFDFVSWQTTLVISLNVDIL